MDRKVLKKQVWGLVLALFLQFLPLNAQAANPDLVVFFIHGLNADSATFCDFPEVLKRQIEAQVGGNIVTQYLEYDTKLKGQLPLVGVLQKPVKQKTTDIFATEIAPQIQNFYLKNKISFSTPYAFVTHSQGGLVVTKYMKTCLWDALKSGKESCVSKGTLPKNLVHNITIGTPHHGSSGATFLIRGIEGLFGEGTLLRWSGTPGQSAGLATGSVSLMRDRLFTVRNHMYSSRRKTWMSPYYGKTTRAEKDSLPTEFHNIVGSIGWREMPIFGKISLGRDIESDLVVSTTSARQDFHYCVMAQPNSPQKCGTTNLTGEDNVYLVDRAHMMSAPLLRMEDDMKCVEQGGPAHPTLDIVRKILLEKFFGVKDQTPKKQRAERFNHALGNFAANLHFFFPDEMKRAPHEDLLKLSFNGSNFQDPDSFIIDGGLLHEYRGANDHNFEYFTNRVERNSLSYFHIGEIDNPGQWLMFSQGKIRKDMPLAKRKHQYWVRYPGFETIKIDLQVSAGMTSFARVYLKPVRPKARNMAQHFNIKGTSQGKFFRTKRAAVKKYFSQFTEPCLLGVIAPTYPNAKPWEPVRYQSFFEAPRKPSKPLSSRVERKYPELKERRVRVHGLFKAKGLLRYKLSQPAGHGKMRTFWMDAKDVDILSEDYIREELELFPEEMIHRQDVCKQTN